MLRTGEGNAQKAKPEEWKQLVQASLSGASMHWAESFLVAEVPFVAEDGGQHT